MLAVKRRSRIALTQAATCAIPPSARSSRATIVSTAWSSCIRSIASAIRSGSSLEGSIGLRVSTRQKPHARVHRSPNTMNVAVPSAQQSDRFGQPASSHTVTRSSERIVFFSSITSALSTTFGRNQFGLRVSIDKPAATSTPASSRRTAARPGVTLACPPGPSPRENAARSRPSAACLHATSCRSATPAAHRSVARRATTAATCSIVTSMPSSASDVTGLSPMPHGTMCSRMNVRSVATLSAKPCIVRPFLSRTPIAQILRSRLVPASSQTPA